MAQAPAGAGLGRAPRQAGVPPCTLILNRQKAVRGSLARLRSFERKLRRALGLGRRELNVCLVDDREITRLNATYRGQARATDVLSFPSRVSRDDPGGELDGFLGDIAISTETARRKARAEGHSLEKEICCLVLHGALHLLGYDHASDRGEMAAREHSMRRRLNIGD